MTAFRDMTVGRVVPATGAAGESPSPKTATRAYTATGLSDVELERIADRLVEKMQLRTALSGRMMDIPETAAYLGRTVQAVQNMVKRGTIPSTKLDGKVQVDRYLLDRLIEAKTA